MCQEKLEIEGAIILKNSEDSAPAVGTIRWSGSDFEGWNGLYWASLTGNRTIGSVTDRDGNTYKTVQIGTQEWMGENLRVRQFNDGRGIPGILSGWEDVTFSARCSYENNESFADTYGYLYNWFAVNDGKLCPNGWWVPSDFDWTVLLDYLGGSNSAGGKMKEAGLEHWRTPNDGANNESGFTGLPAGQRFESDGLFHNLEVSGQFWSSEDESPTKAWSLRLSQREIKAELESTNMGTGVSVRCMRE